MENNKIKLIASDVDGTLLPEGTPYVNPRLFDVILKLKEKGVIFAAASGRQYPSVSNVFAPIKNDIIFIADNGAYVSCREKLMDYRAFDAQTLKEVVEYVRSRENIYYLVSTTAGTFADKCEPEFVKLLEGYKFGMKCVGDVLRIKEPVIKVAMYCRGIDAVQYARPAEKMFAGRVHVMVSGAHWIDFMELSVDKGNALAKIQQIMGILPEETMAFGDNLNDIGMLAAAGESYAVAGAREEVKKSARHVLPDEDDSVLHILQALLKTR